MVKSTGGHGHPRITPGERPPLVHIIIRKFFAARLRLDDSTAPNLAFRVNCVERYRISKDALPPANPGIFFRCAALDPTKPGIKGQFLHPSRPHQTYISPILVVELTALVKATHQRVAQATRVALKPPRLQSHVTLQRPTTTGYRPCPTVT